MRDADVIGGVLGYAERQLKGDNGQEAFGTERLHCSQAEAEAEEAISAKEEADAEREKTVAAIDEAKSMIEQLDEETRVKEHISSELDDKIAEKRDKANTECGNAILSGIVNLAGRGKYAGIAQENERLKASLTDAAKQYTEKYNALVHKFNAQLSARQKAEKQLAEYKRGEADRIDEEVSRRAEDMQEQIGELKAKAKRRNELLSYLAAIFVRVDGLFRKAVEAIINFAQSGFKGKFGGNGHRDIFTDEEAHAINSTMINIAGEDGNHKVVGEWLVQVATTAERLESYEIRRTQK